jgi:Terminase small subunit
LVGVQDGRRCCSRTSRSRLPRPLELRLARAEIHHAPRQQRFVDEYLIDLNATQAAIRAGYSARTAEQQGPATVGKIEIADVVQKAHAVRGERVQITQDDVLRGLQREATLSGDGSSHAARVSAWGLIGKHLGMFIERRQQPNESGQSANPQLFTVTITG